MTRRAINLFMSVLHLDKNAVGRVINSGWGERKKLRDELIEDLTANQIQPIFFVS